MADYVQLLESHDILQTRIDRAVKILNRRFAGLGTYIPKYNSDANNELYEVYRILKGEE